jgi:hypothetical protein
MATNFVGCRQQDTFKQGAGRTFAIGAANGENHCLEI